MKGTAAAKSHATGVENHKSPEEKSSQRRFWQQLIWIVLRAVARRHREEEEEKALRETAPKKPRGCCNLRRALADTWKPI